MRINPRSLKTVSIVACIISVLLAPLMVSASKLIIAKDCAGQNFIENTLVSLPLAIANDVEKIELPLLMTQDDHLIVYKDLTLNRLTDVADHFPNRHRADGGFYVIDFTLDEIRQLRLQNIFDNGAGSLRLAIPTFTETLALIRHLDGMFGRVSGLVLEPGYPQFHQEHDKDISATMLNILTARNILPESAEVYLQSSDPDELQRLKESLLVTMGLDFPLIQVLDLEQSVVTGNSLPPDYSWIFTNSGLLLVATYASYLAIPGPAIINSDGTMPLTGFIQEAHSKGIKILATSLHSSAAESTVQSDESQLLQRRLAELFDQAEIDGLYTTDFKSVQNYLQDKADEQKRKADLPPFFSTLELARPKHDTEQKDEESYGIPAAPLQNETTEQF